MLVEEAGTTDFGGVLSRYYAAEGLVQGHDVHVFGPSDGWVSELPGLDGAGESSKVDLGKDKVPMKIAWRYEALGNSYSPEAGSSARRSCKLPKPLTIHSLRF